MEENTKEINITKEDLIEAYIFLKKTLYYENNNLLHLKYQIAEFEEKNNFLDLEKREKYFRKLEKEIKQGIEGIKKYLTKIKFTKIIKKLEKNEENKITLKVLKENCSDELFYDKLKNTLEVEREIQYNYIIDCPIELHIISMLWIKKIGYLLDSEIAKYSYGYRLENRGEAFPLFKRYYIQYQNWRNNALTKTKEIIKDDEIAIVANLDLKRFYYNVSHNKLKEKLEKFDIENSSESSVLNSNLTEIILEINKRYSEKVNKELKSEEPNTIIPIGLYSSNILANFYLKDLDEAILKLTPYHYGRYVDDMVIVFKEYDNKNNSKIDEIDEEDYIEKKLESILKEEDYLIKLGIENSFSLKNKKQQIDIFYGKKQERKLIEMEKSFLERASTFAFLPNEEDIEKLYKKISDENDDIKEKKYDVSVYLAKILKIFNGVDKKTSSNKLREYVEDILTFFTEENIIKYSLYYEKVFTLLVMGEFTDEIIDFYNKVKSYIKKIENGKKNNNKDNKNIKKINLYLRYSLLFALALNPKLRKELDGKIDKEITPLELKMIVNSNMFKQNMVCYPLINYLQKDYLNKHLENINFFYIRYFDLVKGLDDIKNIQLDKEKLYLSPRFIHLEELNLFYLKKDIFEKNSNIRGYFDNSLENFKFNFKWKNNHEEKLCFQNKVDFYSNYIKNLNLIKISSKDSLQEDSLEKVRIGVASVNFYTSLNKILSGKQELSFERKEIIVSILNEAKKNKVNILIFPEISIPFQWLKLLNEYARKNDIVITGGLEHLCCYNFPYISDEKKEVFNYLFTILPFKSKNEYETSLIKLRLKNYYAPEEKETIEGSYCKVPCPPRVEYDIFSWKGIYFSNFNCYELTDIEGRSKLKNYIDLLIASVYNKDLEYFDNILKSTCRDLHIFIAQSNTSKYGDCEIIQPTEKIYMIKGKIKGGINHNLLVDDIEVKKLREFQLLKNELQKSKKDFKLTPLGINPDIVRARINNKLEEYWNNNNEIKEILKKKFEGKDISKLLEELDKL